MPIGVVFPSFAAWMIAVTSIILNGLTHTAGDPFGTGPQGKLRDKSDGRDFRCHKFGIKLSLDYRMTRLHAYSNKQARALLLRILEFIVGSLVFLLMMVGTVLLMAVLEPSFFSNWF
jgi:hypothetical protein